ncbi:MAG: AI-2E family transporter [Labilithrix sp.]
MILHRRKRQRTFEWLLALLVIGAAAAFLPIWVPFVLAAWSATIARPLYDRVAKVTGRGRAAAVLVVALVAPLVAAAASLSRGAIDLVHAVARSGTAKNALVALASGGGGAAGTGAGGEGSGLDIAGAPATIVSLLQEHGMTAVRVLGGVAGAATTGFIALFVFLYALYAFLSDGPRYWSWIEAHSPIEVGPLRRLAAAFNETGRGLFVGIGLTGLVQGVIATITYFALGVPRALILGLVTCFASLLPTFGTALVWVPVSIGLLLSGQTVPGLILAGVGVAVIGTVDNVMRPVFSRFGRLELPTFVLLTSIFGGLAIFGASGLLLGPLLVRLAKEALAIAKDARNALGHRTGGASATCVSRASSAVMSSPHFGSGGGSG